MKNWFVLTLLVSLFTILNAQDEQYLKIMEETISMMDTAKEVKSLQLVANQFERIAGTIQNEWLPYYYGAYCYTQISHKEKSDNKRDQYVDKAEELNIKAEKISPENAEIYVMKGFILQARMKVEPMIRGFKYNSECLKMFEKAKEIDPDNPRSYLWHGVNLYNTPSFFGGGKEKALPLLEKAIEKFDLFKLQSSIHPDWGQKYAENILLKCKE